MRPHRQLRQESQLHRGVDEKKGKELGIMGREEDGLGPLYNLKRSLVSTVTNLKHY